MTICCVGPKTVKSFSVCTFVVLCCSRLLINVNNINNCCRNRLKLMYNFVSVFFLELIRLDRIKQIIKQNKIKRRIYFSPRLSYLRYFLFVCLPLQICACVISEIEFILVANRMIIIQIRFSLLFFSLIVFGAQWIGFLPIEQLEFFDTPNSIFEYIIIVHSFFSVQKKTHKRIGLQKHCVKRYR